MILADPLAVLLIEGAIEFPARAAIGTSGADRTRLTALGRGLIDPHLGDIVVAPKAEDGSLRTTIDILLRLVGKIALAEERTSFAPVGQRDVGADPLGG